MELTSKQIDAAIRQHRRRMTQLQRLGHSADSRLLIWHARQVAELRRRAGELAAANGGATPETPSESPCRRH